MLKLTTTIQTWLLVLASSALLFHSGHTILALLPTLLMLAYERFKLERVSADAAKPFFDNVRVGGHRGSPTIFPENSMSSFAQAQKDGADLIEFDVAMTKDGYAVILHDDELDRTTNMTGPVRDKNLADLKDANVAAHFKRNGPSDEPVLAEGIPRLEDLVAWAASRNLKMLLDVKDDDSEPIRKGEHLFHSTTQVLADLDHQADLVHTIVTLFKKHDLYNHAIVCSFLPWIVYKIKKADSRILTGQTWRNLFFSYADSEHTKPRFSSPLLHCAARVLDSLHQTALKYFLPDFLGVEMLLTCQSEISPRFVQRTRARGLEVIAWTVNDVSEMQWMLETLKIPILTDRPYHTKTLHHLKEVCAAQPA